MNSLNFPDTNVWLALVWGRHSHAEFARAADHGLTVRVERVEMKMAVRINEHFFFLLKPFSIFPRSREAP